MSLFDLQDVCIVIGSLATLDLPMVVDLIGIYVLKGPYCTLTTTNWFLQELLVIPRGSWGVVARRFTMFRWPPNYRPPSLPHLAAADRLLRRRRRRRPFFFVIGLVSISVTRRIRSCQNPLDLLVQIDGGIAFPVVDLIRRSTAAYLLKFRFPRETGRSQAPRRQQEVERHADDTSTAAAQEEHVECSNKTEIEVVTNVGAIVVRSGPEQPAQQPMNSTGKDPASKGDVFAKPIPVEEHCMLVLKSAWEDVSSRTSDFDKWVHFRTEFRRTDRTVGFGIVERTARSVKWYNRPAGRPSWTKPAQSKVVLQMLSGYRYK
ncbi:isoamylase 1, chloroplastic [Dorcoceras hygrometricum]|uniref:Isoamylase 1, chloroplastic n=1 Tax=Dorcoceras hygrometricum TaxID=472368 RepID=A0A2Z7BJD3_9LAMI|nr:isoamylase 1, chloroplastic [Dorcoceras hygrometricum]